MSKKSYNAKPLSGNLFTGVGDFSSLSTDALNLPQIVVEGLVSGSIFDDVNITNSNISNTIIGVDGANEGYFTTLDIRDDVTFLAIDLVDFFNWDARNGVLGVRGVFQLQGCATISNLSLCQNKINAITPGAALVLEPGVLGNVEINGPIRNVTSYGNFLTESESVILRAEDSVVVVATTGNVNVSAFDDVKFDIVNGDFQVELAEILTKDFSELLTTNGNTVVAGNGINLKIGDTVRLETVGFTQDNLLVTFVSENAFFVDDFLISTAVTAGTFTRTNVSKINLLGDTFVRDTLLIGDTEFTATTGSLVIENDSLVLNTETTVRDKFNIAQSQFVSTQGTLTLDTEEFILDASSTTFSTDLFVDGNFATSDPNVTLGIGSANGTFDKGVQFFDANGDLGWFGYKQDTGSFAFYTNATNSGEIITGTLGTFEIGQLSTTNVTVNQGGIVDLDCGQLLNASRITGCTGLLEINSQTGIDLVTNLVTTNVVTLETLNIGSAGSVSSSTSGIVVSSPEINFDTATTRFQNTDIIYFSDETALVIQGTAGATLESPAFTITSDTLEINSVVVLDDTSLFSSQGNFYIENETGVAIETNVFVTTAANTTFVSDTVLLDAAVVTVNRTLNVGALELTVDPGTATFAIQGDIVLNSDALVVNSGVRVTDAVTIGNSVLSDTAGDFSVLASTVNIDAGKVDIASDVGITGTVSSGSIHVSGDLTVSSEVTFQDPVISIGAISPAGHTGFFFDSRFFGATETEFVYYKEAVLSGNDVVGTVGNIRTQALLANEINIPGGVIDLAGGTIEGVSYITGDGDVTVTPGVIVQGNVQAETVTLDALQFPNGVINSNLAELTISSDTIVLDGNVQITGDTQNVFSTVTNIQDPIISIGGVTGPVLNDLKDRGIEFKWYNGASQTGFFGFDNNLNVFTFVPQATNASEIITGAPGNVLFGNGSFTGVNLNCGVLGDVGRLTGCNGELTVVADVTLDGGLSLGVNETLTLGDTFVTNSVGNLTFQGTLVEFDSQVQVDETLLIGGGQISFTDSNLVINGGDTVVLEPAGFLDTGNPVIFSNAANRIESDGSGLQLYGLDIKLDTGTLTITGDVNITGNILGNSIQVDTFDYILDLGTSQILPISQVLPGAEAVVVTTGPGYYTVGDTVRIKDTNTVPVLDGTYIVTSVIDPSTFTIDAAVNSPGDRGTVTGVLTVYQDKDVGIQVNYWSTVGNTSVTAGSVNYKTGFFGWKTDTQRFSFYNDAVITDNVVDGDLGDIQTAKLFTEKISGFTLDGSLQAGSFIVAGNNFQIQGGLVDNTIIGSVTPSRGAFTDFSARDTVLFNTLRYDADRLVLSTPTSSAVSLDTIVTFITVTGVSLNTFGTLAPGSQDGQIKKIVCSRMGANCTFELALPLISPNAFGETPTGLLFKRQGQSCTLVYDAIESKWIIESGGVYVV